MDLDNVDVDKVDKIEGEIPESGEVMSPGEASAPVEEPALDKAAPSERREKMFEDEPTYDKRSLYLVVVGVIGVPVVLLALAFFGLLYYSTAVYITGLGLIPLAIWLGRKACTVYVVFLGCIIAALLTCIYCLWVAVARYNFDVKAQEAKQRVAVAQPVDRGGLVETGSIAAKKSARS